ncbi:MAG: endonuclease/exonuclease/phosphatase family protein [Phenylobacterium sp.]|uniref:endonuclease/exonuclease/phosphatase family protein n=1 Tax=Phenylobacterium sp. TaxID=1871053 RepID=UPI00391CB946
MGSFLAVVHGLRGLLTLGLGLACAVAALAAQGGRISNRLDVLTHFAPFWLAGGLLAAGVALLSPRGPLREASLSLGALAVLAASMLIAPEYLRPMSPPAPPDAPGRIKLIQFNVWGRNPDVAATADWILGQQPDIVVMQELKAPMREALLARAKGYELVCDHRSVCNTAILTRLKPIRYEIPEHGLPGESLPLAVASFRTTGGRTFTVVGVHYTWPTHGGVQQAQGVQAAAILDRFPKDTLILSGDFNSTPWSFSRRREDRAFGLERRTRALFSWPAARFSPLRLQLPFPFLPIDQVYAGSAWRTVEVRRGPRLGSDHFPVVAVLAPAA